MDDLDPLPRMAPAGQREGLALARTAIDAVLRVGLVVLLAAWCAWIAEPFILPVLWGGIIAVALDPTHERLTGWLGGRSTIAAVILSILGLALMLGPLAGIGVALVESGRGFAESVMRGDLTIPPLPAGLATIPVVGGLLDEYWQLAATNLRQLLTQLEPALRAVGLWSLGFVGGLGLGFLSGLVAIVVAGILLARRSSSVRGMHGVAQRIAGPRGEAMLVLGEETVQAVARGVVGTAFIQAVLATVGFYAIGVPGAPVWGCFCFLLALIQVGGLPVIVPVLIWAFLHLETMPFVLYLIWSVVAGSVDNVLRPLLIGAGAKVPLLVLLVGVIGGLLAHGLIGLFIGPVVMALGHALLIDWLAADRQRRAGLV